MSLSRASRGAWLHTSPRSLLLLHRYPSLVHVVARAATRAAQRSQHASRCLAVLLLCGALTASCWTAAAQTPNSSRPQNTTATPAQQLPLSGRGGTDVQPVVIQQQQVPGSSGSNSSALVTDTTVVVQGPYTGSVSSGKATRQLPPLTLSQALTMGLRTNLGALNQTAAAQQAEGQRLSARSQLLPQVDAGVSETFEKINIRTLGVSSPMLRSTCSVVRRPFLAVFS